jgi:hypothetical protein
VNAGQEFLFFSFQGRLKGHFCAFCDLIPDCLSIASSRIGGAEADAGFFLNHYSFSITKITLLLGELVTA